MSGSVTYEILGLIGSGGFGLVYRARMRGPAGFEKAVALKVLHDEHANLQALARLRDESRILGLLTDRAIVRVEAPVQIDGRWSVVMEYADGCSLAALIARDPLPVGVALEIVGEVARALDHAYRQPGPEGAPLRVVHRDLKPENLQISPAGEVRVLDFGLARGDFAAREAAPTRQLLGTPGYIAPERLSGREGPEGDVFSLGVVLRVALTGEAPTALGADVPAGPLRAALALSAEMRDPDPTRRPPADEVERRCRALRAASADPWLGDWAARHAVAAPLGSRDAWCGQIVAQTGPAPTVALTIELPPPRPRRRALVGLAALGLAVPLIGAVAWEAGSAAPPVGGWRCGDGDALEAAALAGTLTDADRACLDSQLVRGGPMAAPGLRLLLADAWVRGDHTEWKRLARWGLSIVRDDDPSLRVKLALTLVRDTPKDPNAMAEAWDLTEAALASSDLRPEDRPRAIALRALAAWGLLDDAERTGRDVELARQQAREAAAPWYADRPDDPRAVALCQRVLPETCPVESR